MYSQREIEFCSVVDRDGNLDRWGSDVARLTGYADSELESLTITDLIDTDGAIETALESGSASVECAIETATGDRLPYAFALNRLDHPNSAPLVTIMGSPRLDRSDTDWEGETTQPIDDGHVSWTNGDGIDPRLLAELSELVSAPDRSHSATLDRLLELACEYVGVDSAAIIRADGDEKYYIETAVGSGTTDGGPTDALEAALFHPVWHQTIGAEGVTELAIDDHESAGETAAALDGCRAIGGEIRIDGDHDGICCLFDRDGGNTSPSDQAAATLLVRWITSVVTQHEADRRRRWKERAMDAAPIGLTITDSNRPNNPIVYANDGFEQTTGYAAEESIGRNCRFLQGAETDPEQVAKLRSAVENEESATVELRNYRQDGTPFWNHVRIAPVEDESGAVTHFVGFQQDVTERTEMERQLSTLMSNIPGMVYRRRNETRCPFEFISDGCVELTGYDPDELVDGTVSWSAVQHDEDAKLRESIQQALSDGEPFQLTYPIETADGDRRWVTEYGRGVVDDEGSIEAIEGVVIDTTDRVESEHELERTRQLLTQAQRLTNVGAWEIDLMADPPDLVWSDEVARIHGVPTGTDVDVDQAIEFYLPASRDRLEPALDRAIEDGESYSLELQLQRADGDTRWVRSIGDPLVEDGTVVAIRGSIQDITDRKTRGRKLELTSNLLQETERIAGVGGWELDIQDGEPVNGNVTDGVYGIYELDPDDPFDYERGLQYIHPSDRSRVRSAFETAIGAGESYDLEARLITASEDKRWVQLTGKPIVEDGTVRRVRGAIQDITAQKERQLALESLHEMARGQLQAESTESIAELVMETATEMLDADGAGVYLIDSETNAFEPAAATAGFASVCDEVPSIPLGNDDSVLWDAFVSESQTCIEASAADRSPLFETAGTGGLVVPIGDHGVLTFVADPSTIDGETRRLVETLAATTEAAFDRIQTEARLRERDAALEARNQRLKRQIGVNEIIRSVDQSLVQATSQADVERAVCKRLVETDDIAFAWIGGLGPGGTVVDPRAWDGTGEGYLDAVSLATDAETPEPAVESTLSERSTVVSNVASKVQSEPWRKTALAHGLSSCLCVPIAFDEYAYGVLAVYGAEPNRFGDLERAVFEELGETIASSITAVQTRHALHADTLLELTLRFDDSQSLFAQIANQTGATIEYEGISTHSNDETRLFVTTRGAQATVIETVLDDLVSVTAWRLVSTTNDEPGPDDGSTTDRCLFEVTVTAAELVSRLLRHGATPRSITAAGSTLEAVVTVSPATGVREFVEMLAQSSPTVELLGRRPIEREIQTRRELVSSLFAPLTDRQLEVLKTAYFAGFFEWPRTSTGEEIATMIGVSQPTINRHLRIGQQRLLTQLFESDHHALVDR